uniref:Uncharacterized protein n=1 Tax=Aegilops tauschii TaxID=37682 RepID=M8BXW4_AEGTA
MVLKRRRSERAHADRPYRCDSSKRISRNKSAALEAINGFYAAALDRLPLDEMPALAPRLLRAGGCLSCNAIESIHTLLIKPRRKLGALAGVTPPQFHLELNRPPPFVPTKSLRSTLLQKIYGFYLKGLALLPTDGLRTHHHRCLLKAGHCYGPSTDPVSNIVLNTLWYNATFPPAGGLSPATMICSRSLVLVAYRSLRGLVAYIRAYFGMMSEHQAMHCLLFTEVNLWGAMKLARQQGHTEGTMLRQYSAYKAAATAAQHPDPDAVVEFFMSTFPMMPLPKEENEALDVERIQQLLSEYCSTPSDSAHTVPGPEYELHVICGLNSNVGKAFVWGLHYGPLLSWRPKKTQHSHINFLARPRDLHSSDTVPILFFAECSNDEDAVDEPSCWPVTGHPEVCEEDCIYFDADRDAKCAEFLNSRGRTMQGPRLV